MTDEPRELIERYLDELYASLRGPARHARRVLAETEAHLLDAVDARVAAGALPADAERAALADFGPVADFARACDRVNARDRARAVLSDLRVPALFLLGLALFAVGLSGAVDRVLTSAFGAQFVFGDPPGTSYSASACQHWMSLHPQAANCAQAYLAEARDDGLFQRFVVGVLGLAILVALFWWSRVRARTLELPSLVVSAVSAGAFGTAGVVLTAFGVDRAMTAGAHGPGDYLGSGAVCLAATAVALVALARAWEPRRTAAR
jgi:hypothetical protein